MGRSKYTSTVNGCVFNTKSALADRYNLESAVVWQGPSRIDGQPIVLIVTGLKASTNAKTGAMVQTFIMRQDAHPYTAIKTGQDSSVCGNCPHRCKETGNASTRTCYVRGDCIGSVYTCYKRDRYMPYSELPAWIKSDMPSSIRLGSYGDPAAVPVQVWTSLLDDFDSHTGYTHQWRNDIGDDFRGLVQASCDSVDDVVDAILNRWFTFAVKTDTEQSDKEFWSQVEYKLNSSVTIGRVRHCPAAKESGAKTTCNKCKMCSGNKFHVAINLH